MSEGFKIIAEALLCAKLAEYATAPLTALAGKGGGYVLARGEAREEALARKILAGGLDQIGGLHESIRHAATLVVDGSVRDVSEAEAQAARRWFDRLGRHVAPLVTRDWKGRIVRVVYE